MEPGPVSFRTFQGEASKTSLDWRIWYPKLHYKRLLFDVTGYKSPRAPVSSSGLTMAAELHSISPIGVGGHSVVAEAKLDSSVYLRKKYVVRLFPDSSITFQPDITARTARRNLQYFLTEQGHRHVSQLIGHGSIDGIQTELLPQYTPIIALSNFKELKQKLIDMPTQQKERALGSFALSLATSLQELQSGAQVLADGLKPIFHKSFDLPWIVHADVKIQNLLLDTETETIRLSDFDGVSLVPARGEPIKVAPITTHDCAPMELLMPTSVIHDRTDIFMLALAAVCMFSPHFPRPSGDVSAQKVAQALQLDPQLPLIQVLANCLSTRQNRPFLSKLIKDLEIHYEVDMCAREFKSILLTHDEEPQQRAVTYDALTLAQTQQAKPLLLSSAPVDKRPTFKSPTADEMREFLDNVLPNPLRDVLHRWNSAPHPEARGPLLRDFLASPVSRNREILFAGAVVYKFISSDLGMPPSAKKLAAVEQSLNNIGKQSKKLELYLDKVSSLMSDVPTKHDFAIALGRVFCETIRTGGEIISKDGLGRATASMSIASNSTTRAAIKLMVGYCIVSFRKKNPVTSPQIIQQTTDEENGNQD